MICRVYERKLGCTRVVVVRDPGGAYLYAADGAAVTAEHPALERALDRCLPHGTVADGEVAGPDLFLFDVTVVFDHDVTALPLRVRRRLLDECTEAPGRCAPSGSSSRTGRPASRGPAGTGGAAWSRSGPTRRTGRGCSPGTGRGPPLPAGRGRRAEAAGRGDGAGRGPRHRRPDPRDRHAVTGSGSAAATASVSVPGSSETSGTGCSSRTASS